MNPHQSLDELKETLESRLRGYGIPSSFINDLVSRHNVVTHEKGTRLFLRGAPADLLFWIFSGLAKVYFPRPEGDRILIHIAGPSDLVGNVNHLDSRGRRVQSFEVEALTRCTAALFTREHVIKSLQALNHQDLIEFVEGLNTAWSISAQRYATFFGMSFRERLEYTLHDLGTKFGVRDSRGVVLMPELTQTDLAEMIGCSRPMISRILADMKVAGLVLNEYRRFVLLKHLAA